jgi:hypothetical protein
MYSSTLPSTSALDDVDSQRHVPAALPPGKTPYPLYRRLGRPQGRSRSPPPVFDPRTVQPVASRYTELIKMRVTRHTKLYMAKAKIFGPSTETLVFSQFEQIPLPCTCRSSFHDTKTSTSQPECTVSANDRYIVLFRACEMSSMPSAIIYRHLEGENCVFVPLN